MVSLTALDGTPRGCQLKQADPSQTTRLHTALLWSWMRVYGWATITRYAIETRGGSPLFIGVHFGWGIKHAVLIALIWAIFLGS